MGKQKIYLCVGEPQEPKEALVSLVIEEHNRDDVKDVIAQMIDRIYDDVDEEPDWEDISNA